MVSIGGALFLTIVSLSCLYFCKVFLKRTASFWIKILFPLGYAVLQDESGLWVSLKETKGEENTSSLHHKPHHIVSFPGTPINTVVTILPVALLDDNYAYLIIDTVSNTAVVIDPCDPATVMKAVADKQITLTAILTTHKHWDHSGGNALLRKRFPNLPVYGGAVEKVPAATHQVEDGGILKFGRLTFEGILTPGHTTGHMMYKLMSEPPCLFSGDHIFVCGNGMMFEGSPEVMLGSIKKAMLLPKNTLLFPGHEYALRDVKFATQLLPTNRALQMKWQWVKQQRERGLSTVPSILSEELQYNPFMLTEDPALREALGLPGNTSAPKVLAELRKQKNAFSKTNY